MPWIVGCYKHRASTADSMLVTTHDPRHRLRGSRDESCCSMLEVKNEKSKRPISIFAQTAGRLPVAGFAGVARQYGAADCRASLSASRSPAHLAENRPERRRQDQPGGAA